MPFSSKKLLEVLFLQTLWRCLQMVFLFSTRVRCLPSTPNLANSNRKVTLFGNNTQSVCRIALFCTDHTGKITLFRKNIQSVCKIALFCTQIRIECDRNHIFKIAADELPIQSGSSLAPYASRHNRPDCFFTIHCFYENAQSGGCYSRAGQDRLLELLSPPAKLIRPFALGLAAYGSIAPSAQRKEVAS